MLRAVSAPERGNILTGHNATLCQRPGHAHPRRAGRMQGPQGRHASAANPAGSRLGNGLSDQMIHHGRQRVRT
jgi:hypothetical protein